MPKEDNGKSVAKKKKCSKALTSTCWKDVRLNRLKILQLHTTSYLDALNCEHLSGESL